MSLAFNKPKLDNLAGDIWKSADRLRGKFKPYEYQGVILIAAPLGKGRARCAAAGPEPEGRLPDPLAFPPAFRKESPAVD